MGRLLRLAAVAVVILAAAALTWRWLHPPPPPLPHQNLLLVSIDTLRADRLGYAGYAAARTPRLDGLAARGMVFTRATTPVPLTLPAHASLLTGTFPGRHGVRDNGHALGEDQVTLAEVLRGAGYRTGGFVGSFLLDSRWGIHQGFDRYFDDFDLARPSPDAMPRRGDEVVAQALAWLDQDPGRPFFAWVHLNDPHAPYDAPEPYRSQFPAGTSGAYDAEVAWTDSLVGRLLDHLALRGLADRTWVVVAGDHGESLGEHGEQGHGFFLYETTLHVPLVISGPPPAPRSRVDEQVSIVDVMPTAVQALVGVVPQGVQGHSLFPREGRNVPRLRRVAFSETWLPRIHFGWSELLSIRDGRHKLIRAPRPELYDLHADPLERHDLAAADPARTAALQKALTEAAADVGGLTLRVAAPVDAEAQERLQAQGYLGGFLGRRHIEDRPRDDPKDKIGLFHLLRSAAHASAEGRQEAALALAGEALASDPGIVEGHTLVGNVHGTAGRHEAAADAYRRALALDPEHPAAAFGLALASKDLGRTDDAEAGFERARELDPRGTKALWQLADLWMRKGRFAEAEAALKEALDRKADRPSFLLKLGECSIEMKRYVEAEAILKEALAGRPGLARAHFDLALVHEARGDPARATAEYEAELQRDPRDREAGFNLARLLQRQGRLEDAAARFRATLEAAPDFATTHLYLAKTLLDLGDLPGARAAARRGLAAHPDPQVAPMGHYVLADVYTREGRRRDAAREISKARRLERKGP